MFAAVSRAAVNGRARLFGCLPAVFSGVCLRGELRGGLLTLFDSLNTCQAVFTFLFDSDEQTSIKKAFGSCLKLRKASRDSFRTFPGFLPLPAPSPQQASSQHTDKIQLPPTARPCKVRSRGPSHLTSHPPPPAPSLRSVSEMSPQRDFWDLRHLPHDPHAVPSPHVSHRCSYN